MASKKCLNLGCGHDYRKSTSSEDWTNLDKDENPIADIKHDINRLNFPFKDNYFDYVFFSHVIEHLDPNLNLMSLFNELSRILKEGGILELRCPHFSNWTAYELVHRRYFNFKCFTMLPQFSVVRAYFFPYNHESAIHKRGFFSEAFNNLTTFFANLNPPFFERVWCHWTGGVPEMRFILKNRKIKKQEIDLYLKSNYRG